VGPFERFRRNVSAEGDSYSKAELQDEAGCARRQRALSEKLIGLIDVLYALVLVEGAVAYRSLFVTDEQFLHPEQFLPVVLALILIFFTTIHSFIDYHFAAEDQPYQFLDKQRRRDDLGRFYLDVVIVGLYSFILLKCHVLLVSPGGDLSFAFFAFPVLFLLFICWGELRRRTAPDRKQPYDLRLLSLFLFAYGLLAMVYLTTARGWVVNSVFLLAALLLMGLYRWLNWRQNRWCASTS
jgi:hypothetical protein